MRVDKILGFSVLLVVVLFFVWSLRDEVRLSATIGTPVSSCVGQADGTACVLSSASAILTGNVLAQTGEGVCKGGKCVVKTPDFSCPVNTLICTKGGKSICCPTSSYGCISISNPLNGVTEPYCSPKSQSSCPSGTTYCNPRTLSPGDSSICCPSGTTCTHSWGYAVCKESDKKNNCPDGTNKCGYFCCSAGESCVSNPLDPEDESAKICSASSTSCVAPKSLCASTSGSGYPNICCGAGTCLVNPSGRAFCSDGDPGVY